MLGPGSPRPELPTAADVERAASGLGGRVHRTPLLTSATLAGVAGAPVFLKAELLQRTGSFKPRGVFTRLDSLTEAERRRGVVSISAGNHAQALAYACAQEGIDCLVVMWQGGSPLKLAAARGYGATVDAVAADMEEGFERLAEIQAASGRVLVHPYDDALVVAGQGTVGLEILADAPEVDVVLVPVGGGGLVSGIATAVKGRKPGARVIAVEPERSPALGEALAAGRPVRIESGRTVADGLAAPVAGELACRICADLGVEQARVSEAELRAGFRFLYQRAKLAAEPAGAAGVAALLAGKVDVAGAAGVAVVVSGGNVAAQTASDILAEDEG